MFQFIYKIGCIKLPVFVKLCLLPERGKNWSMKYEVQFCSSLASSAKVAVHYKLLYYVCMCDKPSALSVKWVGLQSTPKCANHSGMSSAVTKQIAPMRRVLIITVDWVMIT